MNWFRRMMYGRYGNDQFGNFLFVLYLLLFVLPADFYKNGGGTDICSFVSMLVIVLYFSPLLFSRNIVNRQRENQKFLKF